MHRTESSSRWALRAASAGLLACGLGAVIGTSRYLMLPGAERLDWSVMPLVIAAFTLITGLSMGLCLGATTRFAARRGAGLAGLMAAGAVGGVLAGIVPGILGIAGFGSLSAPYMGAANILGSILVGAIAFVSLWSPVLFPSQRPMSALRHVGHAAIASVVSLGAFGMMSWTLLRTFDLVPTFDTLADLALEIGIMPFAVVGGVLLGAAGGAAIGAACALVRRLGR